MCGRQSVDTPVTDADTAAGAGADTVRRFEEAGVRVITV
jgi:hypothetical protein